MPIRARGKSWQVDIQVGRTRIRRTAGSKAQARKLEADLKRALVYERPPDRGLEEGLVKYLQGAARTNKDYNGALSKARLIRPHIAGRTFHQISDAADDIISSGLAANLKPATINRRLALLRRIANLAHDSWGWLDQPLGRRVKLLPEYNERHLYLTPAQVDALAAAAPAGVGETILLAAYTGLRKSELLRLTKACYRDESLWVSAHTKTGLPRVVPVPQRVAHIAEGLPLKTSESHLRAGFEAARAKTNLPQLHFHDLRHTYASLLVQAGTPLYTIGALLGHSTPKMTARYAHLRNDDLKAAVAGLGQIKLGA